MYVNMQATKQQHRSGKIMLEGWVDDVLTNSPWLQQQQHTSTGSVRGAVAAGLSRKQLLAAGLSVRAVEQLHRCLYVYSMGFVDTVKVRSCRLCRHQLSRGPQRTQQKAGWSLGTLYNPGVSVIAMQL